jgi:hypothetical protein
MTDVAISNAITLPVSFAMGLRCSMGLLSCSAFNLAPTAAVAGIAAQIMHMVTPLFPIQFGAFVRQDFLFEQEVCAGEVVVHAGDHH